MRTIDIAVCGSGIGGLATALALQTRGHQVTIFEKQSRPGGLNTYGVAEYKLTAAASLQEVEWVKQHGVEVRSGLRVGDGDSDGSTVSIASWATNRLDRVSCPRSGRISVISASSRSPR